MKIRSGFVSNSSTSSFVLLGYKENSEMLEKMTDDERDDFHNRDDVVTDGYSGTTWIGETLAREKNGCMSDAEFSTEELQQKAIALMEKYGVELDKIKLYMGRGTS